ncbi:MAG: YggS family pyridoxal phosphate-dependent enzyme [Nanoarchaeota archaeon]|nr:YggS family pyridoxal phosphate-dependent enzyme [Nanoarchaeota archaeon]
MPISENIDRIRERIGSSAEMTGRNPSSVRLMAVTKLSTVEQMMEAISCGIDLIGENRVQNAAEKFPSLPAVEKHMIGHLQTNKVGKAVELFDCIQSLDSLKLAKEIDKRAKDIGKVMPVFIEVNPDEESKHGVRLDEVAGFYGKVVKLTNVKVIGLMALAPYVPAEETRPFFKRISSLNKKLGLKELSIGMTNDFEVAIEEGSTLLRLGRAIFG